MHDIFARYPRNNTFLTPQGKHGKLWDPEDLPKYFPKARIFYYEYNMISLSEADGLVEDIYAKRKEVQSHTSLLHACCCLIVYAYRVT